MNNAAEGLGQDQKDGSEVRQVYRQERPSRQAVFIWLAVILGLKMWVLLVQIE